MIEASELMRTEGGLKRTSWVAPDFPGGTPGDGVLAIEGGRLTRTTLGTSHEWRRVPLIRITTCRGSSVRCAASAGLLTIGDDLGWTLGRAAGRPPGHELVVARLATPVPGRASSASEMSAMERPGMEDDATGFTGEYGHGWIYGFCLATERAEAIAQSDPVPDGSGKLERRLARSLSRELAGEGGEKHLPHSWKRAPLPFRWGLLGGLVDGAGEVACVGPEEAAPWEQCGEERMQVQVEAGSRRLARSIVDLGHSLGLTAGVEPHVTPAGELVYFTTFPPEEAAKLKEALRLTSREKAATLARSKPGKATGYAPPLPARRLLELLEALERACGQAVAFGRGRRLTQRRLRLKDAIQAALRETESGRLPRPLLRRPVAGALFETLPSFFERDGWWARWKRLTRDERFSWEIARTVEPLSPEEAALEAPGPNLTGAVLQAARCTALTLFTSSGFGVAPRAGLS